MRVAQKGADELGRLIKRNVVIGEAIAFVAKRRAPEIAVARVKGHVAKPVQLRDNVGILRVVWQEFIES